MLERASTCLESGGRQIFRQTRSKPSPRSSRMLHSSFWHHGASDLNLSTWCAAASVFEPAHGSDDSGHGRNGINSSVATAPGGLLLDFLYPEKTLALIRCFSKYTCDAPVAMRKHQLNRGTARQFSTTRWNGNIMRTSASDPHEVETQHELDRRLLDSTPAEALSNLLVSKETEKQQLAWRLYSASRERSRSPELKANLLEYLAASHTTDSAVRILEIFDALPMEARRCSSYRAAISAYLSLEMVGAAVRLHEDAASQSILGDIGTGILLGRVVAANQWDLSLRVSNGLRRRALHTEGRPKRLPTAVGSHASVHKLFLGVVSRLPYLRGNLESFLLYVETFQHELLSTEESQAGLKFFLDGFACAAIEHILSMDPADEKFIFNFFDSFFDRLRKLSVPASDLYEYTIRRMLKIPRYQEYMNKHKIYIRLYRRWRLSWIADPTSVSRPSRKLMREFLMHVGQRGSERGVAFLVNDLQKCYPEMPFTYPTLRYLLEFYADLGIVDKVQDLFQYAQNNFRDKVNIRMLASLLHVYARRVDVSGTKQQFMRISEEFGLVPDLPCWNILLNAHCRADDLDSALACFNDILNTGLKLDIHTFGPLLNLCASRGDVEAFEALFSRAEQLNVAVRQDMEARAGYVRACLVSDDAEGAEATASSMLIDQSQGLLEGSLTHSWNMIIQHYALKGDIGSCRRLYLQMLENNIKLDTWTYAGLMRALVEVRQTNAAFRILRVTMPAKNVQVLAFHYALCIVGFIRERQYELALGAQERMMKKRIAQTADSRNASLHILGITELQRLRDQQDADPRTRLSAVEQMLRAILSEDVEPHVARRQARLQSFIDPRQHSVLASHFGLLIMLYNTRGAYDICKELFEAASLARADEADYEVPITLLTAIMDAHLKAKEYDEVAKCWHLARKQAEKLVKTFDRVVNPPPPTLGSDSLVGTPTKASAEAAKIGTNRANILSRAMRIYLRSLLAQNDTESLRKAQSAIRGLLTSGFSIDNLAWNEFIQALARRGRVVDAFTACETYLMPGFPGWRKLYPFYVRSNLPGYSWMEFRHYDINKASKLPRYKTFVFLAEAFATVKRDEANGMGYMLGIGGWARQVLEKIAPRTIKAIETMPRTGDSMQKKYLADN